LLSEAARHGQLLQPVKREQIISNENTRLVQAIHSPSLKKGLDYAGFQPLVTPR